MAKSLDFDAPLMEHTKMYKQIPEQLTNVKIGTTIRLLKSLNNRKSSRMSVFDSIHSLNECKSAAPEISNALSKLHNKQEQLIKWKQKKEQKKKIDAKNRKKPFLVGVAPGYLPPLPAPTKPMRSTHGHATRSQTRKTTDQSINNIKNSSELKAETSFALPNTSFHPPQIKNLLKYPTLANLNKKTKKNNTTISFHPILPKKTLKVDVNKTIAAKPTIFEKVTETAPKKPVVIEKKRDTRRQAVDLKSKSDIIVQKSTPNKRIETSTSTSSLEQSKSIVKSPVVKMTSCSRQSINKTPRTSIPKSGSMSEGKLRSRKNMSDAQSINKTPRTSIPKSGSMSEGKLRSRKNMSDAQSINKTPRTSIPKSGSMSEGKLRSRKNMSDAQSINKTPRTSIPKSGSMSEGKLRSRKNMSDAQSINKTLRTSIPKSGSMSEGKLRSRKNMSDAQSINKTPRTSIPKSGSMSEGKFRSRKNMSDAQSINKTPRTSIPKSESMSEGKLRSRKNMSDAQSINKTPRTSIPKSGSMSEGKLRSRKNMSDAPMTPIQIAEESKKIIPCITISRFMSNARNEMKTKIEEGLLYADASSESVERFGQQLASKTDRSNPMCNTLDDISHNIISPDHLQSTPTHVTPDDLNVTACNILKASNTEAATKSISPSQLNAKRSSKLLRQSAVDDKAVERRLLFYRNIQFPQASNAQTEERRAGDQN